MTRTEILEFDTPQELVEFLHTEMTRMYLEEMGKAIWSKDYTVSQEEAEEVIEKVRLEREFESMMHNFVMEVCNEPDKDLYQIVMSTKHLDWIRWFHQKNQTLGIYTGRRKVAYWDRGDHKRVRTTPKLFGVPIHIDETVEKPRLV